MLLDLAALVFGPLRFESNKIGYEYCCLFRAGFHLVYGTVVCGLGSGHELLWNQ